MPSVNARRPVEPQYTESEAAELLRVSKKTMQRRRSSGKFGRAPWCDHGVWKYPASALNEYIDRRRVAA